jgi:CheY-like chemotaxis protein/anti-sigma regulatory factor (Ser/Thr protein kinase)
MATILVVEDTPEEAVMIEGLLEKQGFDVQVATQGREALAMLAKSTPDVIVTDLNMPEMDGLELMDHLVAEHPRVPVILMTAFGSEDIAVAALKKGAAYYIPKRHLTQDLAPSVRKLISVRELREQRAGMADCFRQAEAVLRIDNDLDRVAPTAAYLEDLIAFHLQIEDDPRLVQVGTSVSEAITNGIEHGNLEIDSSIRQEDFAAFVKLARQRATEKPYRDRKIEIRVRIELQRVSVTVADEGKGFDPDAVPDPSDPANLLNVSGRGLFLISSFMDVVSHNERGNAITMVKDFEGEFAG